MFDLENTLFLSDLDGTLLRRNQKISAYTAKVIPALIEKGMHFSYATARSRHTASRAADLPLSLPIIVYNGAAVMDSRTGKRLLSRQFAPQDARMILDTLLSAGVQPIVYAWRETGETFSYCPDAVNAQTRDFLLTRRGDVRDHPVQSEADLLGGEVFYFTCIDTKEKLEPLYRQFADRFSCVYSRDPYTGEQWLELMPADTGKAQAARRLCEYLGCKYLVAFGDGENDCSIFAAADAAYAVANAVPELKKLATDIIESNEADGPARWLWEHYGDQTD